MSIPIEVLEAEVLSLSPAQRSHLLDRLLASLIPDVQWEEAWAREADRREVSIKSESRSGFQVKMLWRDCARNCLDLLRQRRSRARTQRRGSVLQGPRRQSRGAGLPRRVRARRSARKCESPARHPDSGWTPNLSAASIPVLRLIYRPSAGGVRIVVVAHQHRRPGYWRGRT